MDKCPITGAPCSNPKIIHVTDVGPGYSAEKSYDLCQVCAANKAQEQPKPEAQLHPIVKNLFDLLSVILTAKVKQAQEQQKAPEPVAQQPIQTKPPCPSCGTTINDIITTQKLGCGECYEHYKTELLPVIIHAHKSAEHVGKRPKHKQPLMESLAPADQIYLLEMQMKLAVEQEQYEKAKEIKDKLAVLKSASPQSGPSAS